MKESTKETEAARGLCLFRVRFGEIGQRVPVVFVVVVGAMGQGVGRFFSDGVKRNVDGLFGFCHS